RPLIPSQPTGSENLSVSAVRSVVEQANRPEPGRDPGRIARTGELAEPFQGPIPTAVSDQGRNLPNTEPLDALPVQLHRHLGKLGRQSDRAARQLTGHRLE